MKKSTLILCAYLISSTERFFSHIFASVVSCSENELRKMQNLEGARKEMGLSDKDDKPLKQNMFKVV